MPRYPYALALGLMRLPPGASAAYRTETRIALALVAARHGYALTETVEALPSPTPTDGPRDPALDAALATVERLALRLDADALIVTGALNDERVEDLAARVRLVVLRHPDPQPPGPTHLHPDPNQPGGGR
jgi:hypothetical protein